jgi:hypothetical protein
MISFIHTVFVLAFVAILFFLSKHVTRKLHLWDEIGLADRSLVFLLTFIMSFLTIIAIVLILASDEVTFLGL